MITLKPGLSTFWSQGVGNGGHRGPSGGALPQERLLAGDATGAALEPPCQDERGAREGE